MRFNNFTIFLGVIFLSICEPFITNNITNLFMFKDVIQNKGVVQNKGYYPLNTTYIENKLNITNEEDEIKNYSINVGYHNTTNSTCKLCNIIIKIIQYDLKVSNKTITEIEKIIRDLCNLLDNPSKQQECFDILGLMNDIVQMIISGLEPGEICNKIGFCHYVINKYINISFF